jgi:hypothetical protein
MPSLALGRKAGVELRRKVRRAYRALIRRRSYDLRIRVVDASTDIDRQTILTPSPGRRIRFIRVKALQEASDGRHLWELFFGQAGNIITAPNRSIDILAVPELGSAATRTFRKDQGPRGRVNEVLSGRWRGTAPTTVHKIVIEYTEES